MSTWYVNHKLGNKIQINLSKQKKLFKRHDLVVELAYRALTSCNMRLYRKLERQSLTIQIKIQRLRAWF